MSLPQPNPKAVTRPIPARLLLPTAAILATITLIWSATSTLAAPDTPTGMIVVNTLADQFGANLGSCSLREAIQTANTGANFGGCTGAGGAATILLGAGEHVLSISGNDDDESAIGDLDVKSSLTIVGLGPLSTTIRPSATFSDRLVDIKLGAIATISGVRLAGDATAIPESGAGVRVQGTLYLNRCEIDHHSTDASGGGALVTISGRLEIRSCAFHDNNAISGGGVSNQGTLLIEDSVFLNNRATASRGGGILHQIGSLTVIRSTISVNTANEAGGGIAVTGGETTLTDSTVSGNSAPDSGGMLVSSTTSPGSLELRNSAILSNSATSAAGMRITSTLATLVNSTVSGNVAQAGAGGIAVNSANGRLYLYNTTIANNTTNAGASGGNGGGLNIQSGSVVSMTNSVLANNIDLGASGDSPDCFGTIHLVAYNHVENTASCATTGPATGNVTGSDPNLRALANNGGPTLTHLPNAGSPLVDTGDPAGCADPAGGDLLTDQRGFSRPVNGGSALRCDKGSTERGSFQMRLALPMIAR